MNIGIIGLGLMGGSFGRTLVKQGEHTVYAFDTDNGVMVKGELLKAYNYPLNREVAPLLDLLIAAVYPDAFESAVSYYLPYLKDGAVVTDFCGTKRKVVSVMKKMAEKYPKITFIGGHPMAGREFSGIDRSVTTLFDKASMILVPVNADIFALSKAKDFYLSLGFGNVVVTDAASHDANIAFTSQLCHVVSNAFIKNKTAENHFGYSAGSYRDLTRVARLSPDMWAGLMMENRDELSKQLTELLNNLAEYKDALDTENYDKLKTLLAEGSERKIAIDSRNVKK